MREPRHIHRHLLGLRRGDIVEVNGERYTVLGSGGELTRFDDVGGY